MLIAPRPERTIKKTIDDVRIRELKELVPPAKVIGEFPCSESSAQLVFDTRGALHEILHGRDDRLIVVIGPCSIHDPRSALEYASRLSVERKRYESALELVMRTYFEKPRTTVGWKGMINDPALNGSFRVNEGLALARRFLLDVVASGLPVGCEFLDPITAEYLADAVSWGAIGARTSQSQIHRQLASGLSMPVGFKNAPDGDVQGAVDAVAAARATQVFPGIDADGRAAILETSGNPDGHVVLRGTAAGPNYGEAEVTGALERLAAAGLPRCVIIDASHDNSRKDHRRQPGVAADIARRVAAGERAVVGMMLESFLVQGRQDPAPGGEGLVYGQSITDPCIDWPTTVEVLGRLARAVAR